MLLKVKGAGALQTIDVRWSRMNKAVIGSVVFTYGQGVDVAALGGLVKAVAKPIEGEKERWSVEGGRLALSYFPSNMEGETVVAFEPAQLEGDPIGDGAGEGKAGEGWEVKGKQRDQKLKAAAPRTDEEASGRGKDDADDAPDAAARPDKPDAPDTSGKPDKPAGDGHLQKGLDDI